MWKYLLSVSGKLATSLQISSLRDAKYSSELESSLKALRILTEEIIYIASVTFLVSVTLFILSFIATAFSNVLVSFQRLGTCFEKASRGINNRVFNGIIRLLAAFYCAYELRAGI